MKSEQTKVSKKTLNDYQALYNCRFHPTDSWHEVGCPHQQWAPEQVQMALNSAKQSNAYLVAIIAGETTL